MAETGTLARPYARAVFELARENGNLPAWSKALRNIADVVGEPDARAFLARRELDSAARVSFLLSIFADAGAVLDSAHGRNLLRLLAENHRLDVLPEISAQFDALKARAENTVKVQLITAAGVEQAVVSRIGEALERKLGRAVELELQRDPDLLGGAGIQAEVKVIDGSVRSRLTELAGVLIA